MSQLQTAYRFDKYHYYIGKDQVMANADGSLLLPPDDTTVAPETKEGYWSKYDPEKKTWTNEKIPTTCQEAIDSKLSVVANSPEPRDRELVALFDKLVAAEKTAFRVATDSKTNVSTIEAIPAPTLDEAREDKLAELAAVAGIYDQYKCDEMYVVSSLGWKANSDSRSITNMRGLITQLDDKATTQYKDYDNAFHEVTKAQLTTLKDECVKNGQALYQQKWAYQTKINEAKTVDEIKAITFEFTMADFSKKA